MLNNWQRDPKWGKIKLGFSNTTIEDFGCTISCLGNIIGVTPDVVNERMKSVNGFANGNLVIWDKIPQAFPGITVKRVWSYNNDDVLAHVPNVLVEVPAKPIGGNGSHWVVFIGNKKLNDPWTGKERPTSDFPNPTGYCIVTGTWKDNSAINTQLIPQQPQITDQTKIPLNFKTELEEYGILQVDQIKDKIKAKDKALAEVKTAPKTEDPPALTNLIQWFKDHWK